MKEKPSEKIIWEKVREREKRKKEKKKSKGSEKFYLRTFCLLP